LNWLSILALSMGLAMDAFAVSISAGLNSGRLRTIQVLRLSLAFGIFQFLMPLLGWFVGREVALLIGAFDHWIAFGLLAFIGGKMLWEARSDRDSRKRDDPTRGVMLLILSLATSIDALAVGLSLAFLRVPILIPSAVIGVITLTLTALGATFGSRIGQKWGIWAEVAGGCVLLAIGSRILITHLAG
jgi:putative Mn2+ efflux pump MntP